ncbi:hypothetical protein IWW38_005758, partial [Coemansia aciculifera]
MSEGREDGHSPRDDGIWDSAQEEFVSIRYLSPEAADVVLEENDYNTIAGYFDDEDNEGDDNDNEDEYATDS